jgi:hypothetical protein
MYILQLFSLSYYCTLNITTVSYLETNEIKGPMTSELGKKSFVEVIDPERLGHRFFYLKLATARYKNRNLKPRNRIGRLKNRNSKRTDTSGRYKNRNLRPRNRIGRLKNRNSKRTDTIGRYKNRNLTSTDCIVRYNRKIESVSENRSIGPFAHLCLRLMRVYVALQRQNTEISKQIFPEKEIGVSVPISPFMCL